MSLTRGFEGLILAAALTFRQRKAEQGILALHRMDILKDAEQAVLSCLLQCQAGRLTPKYIAHANL